MRCFVVVELHLQDSDLLNCRVSQRYTTSIPMHPIASMLNHGLSVCLCSDNPSVFGNPGVSFDFYQVLVSSEQTGLITLGEIALNSLKVGHACHDKFRSLQLTMARFPLFLSIRRLKARRGNGRSGCGRRGG